ncbi:uncharacterized skeletal organic matrix protein 3-like isoform X2 [Montipora capricornis]|uniref:uncharacterized skeletal organic matrix protein 3-like isoform X2 n=1 Tax=Montipora capricornis TaxID=246305 RepID=UPI0035F162B3
MKICGFQKLSVFFGHIFVVFLMSNGINGFTVVRSTTTIGTSNADRFSNPSCGSLDCLPRFNGVHGSSGCGSSDCCFCECDHNSPTFLILNHDNRCVPNDEIDEACSSDDSPLRVADITKSGQVIVTLHDPQFCRTGWTLQQWSHGVSGSQWTIGPQNFFSIKQVQESVNILVLSWSTGLDAKYSGLILKVQFSCRNSRSQCLLMKSKGNYTIPGTSPSLKPSDLAVDVTGKKAKPTNISGISSGSNSRAEPPAKTQRKLEGKQTGIVVAGVTISLAAGFVLAFATLLLFKRKQKEAVVQGRRRPNAPNLGYEEPINRWNSNARARAEPKTTVSSSFLNEFYTLDCVLSLDGSDAETKVNRMGPLPPVPGEEGIYEEPVFKRNVAYQGLAGENKPQDGVTSDASSDNEPQPPEYKIIEPVNSDDSDEEGHNEDEGHIYVNDGVDEEESHSFDGVDEDEGHGSDGVDEDEGHSYDGVDEGESHSYDGVDEDEGHGSDGVDEDEGHSYVNDGVDEDDGDDSDDDEDSYADVRDDNDYDDTVSVRG